MATGYLWLKAQHSIGLVCWFAGLFYFPRLFVLHSSAADAPSRERFKILEDTRYRIITRPAMPISVVFGVWMLVLIVVLVFVFVFVKPF